MKKSKAVRLLKKYMIAVNKSSILPFNIKLVMKHSSETAVADAWFEDDGTPIITIYTNEIVRYSKISDEDNTHKENLKLLITHETAHIIDMLRMYNVEGKNPVTDIRCAYMWHRYDWKNDFREVSRMVFNIGFGKLNENIRHSYEYDRSPQYRKQLDDYIKKYNIKF